MEVLEVKVGSNGTKDMARETTGPFNDRIIAACPFQSRPESVGELCGMEADRVMRHEGSRKNSEVPVKDERFTNTFAVDFLIEDNELLGKACLIEFRP